MKKQRVLVPIRYNFMMLLCKIKLWGGGSCGFRDGGMGCLKVHNSIVANRIVNIWSTGQPVRRRFVYSGCWELWCGDWDKRELRSWGCEKEGGVP